MDAVKNESRETTSHWQNEYLALLPEIEERLSGAFRHLDPESREECTREAIAHSLFAYVRLHDRGKAGVATASSLAWYSSRQVKRGRPAAGRMNSREPLSLYGQISNGIRVEHEPWIDTLIDNTRWTVSDQVAVRLDACQWFKTLTRRLRHIARDLAHGFSTSEVAKKYGLSPGRISQLRRQLHQAWHTFQGESSPDAA